MPGIMDKNVKAIAKSHGFELLRGEELAEISGYAWIMRHSKTGARLIFLDCDDNNKAFSIGFKTPPQDSTGVFHILEHSVLCGSEKYPVKEPFVNLLKGSMQTFLNAMTYPDKTVYPVASTNEKDLENLMRVYLDAVFNPRIYTTPQIFLQEGWHKTANDANEQGFSGVVYNEMKGALSDPDSIFFDAICAQLYPGTCYEFESGGLPSDIPTLTYEKFIDTHARHYSPNNSYISLYGNIDLDRFLRIIDEDFLSPVQAKIDSGERPKGNPNKISQSCQTSTEILDVEMDIKEESAVSGIAFKLCDAKDVVTIHEIDLLMDVLMSKNVSPIKAKLIESGIASDYYSTLIVPVAQPALIVACQGAKNSDSLLELEKIFVSEIEKIVEDGLNHELIEAEINHSEFEMREHNFGTADGVVNCLELLSSWLYDENESLGNLKFESIYAQMRKDLASGEFEKVAKKFILDNKDIARVRVIPRSASEDEKVVKITAEEAREIQKAEKQLNEFQMMPDMEENVAKLPYLTKDDVGKEIRKLEYESQQEGDFKLIAHRNLDTKGINYYKFYIDCSELAVEDLPYLRVLTKFFGKFDTAEYSAEEFDFECRKSLGKFAAGTYIPWKSGREIPLLTFSISCLEGNAQKAAELLDSVMHRSIFDNAERAMTILKQSNLALDQALINSGNVFAKKRAAAPLSISNYFSELMSGIEYKKFLSGVSEGGEEAVAAVLERVSNIEKIAFDPKNITFSYSSSDEDARDFLSRMQFEDFASMPDMKRDCVKDFDLSMMPDMKEKEAFAVKSDVTFAAAQNHLSMMPGMDGSAGVWSVASRILSYDYLWNTVRVQGGAYGCGFNASRDGNCGFYSYRDPNVTSTLERFKNAGAWLKEFSPTEREFDGFIVSTVAGIDRPLKPSAMIELANTEYFNDFSEDDREKTREEVLSCAKTDICELGDAVTEIAKSARICVIGNEETLRASNEFSEVVAL